MGRRGKDGEPLRPPGRRQCVATIRCADPARYRVASQTVFVRSSKNFVYRSANEGRSWERQNWKMEKTAEDDRSGILSFHVSPGDTSKVRAIPSARLGTACAAGE